jgi:thiamine biosynthesis lipoprotein
MGTLVTVEVVEPAPGAPAAIDRAFGWFHEIERRCSRFLPESELVQATARPGVPAPASPILFETVRFALLVAEASGGAFDPVREGGTYRDIELDPEARTIAVRRPLTLDLGAVAKGLAVGTAARELASFRNFAVDAGGDLYLGGRNPQGEPWRVGIPHPRRPGDLIASVRVSDQAVCTSGDYERGHHILDPRGGAAADRMASVTVIAPDALLADALATAAFVLGPAEGIDLLERSGVEGLLVTPELEQFQTRTWRHAA